jgi:hypothetical protein
VHETAVELNLPPRDLGHLARHLRRVNPHWRLTPNARHELAKALVADGGKAKDVVDLARVSYSTVASLRATSPRPAEATPQPMEPCALFSTESRGAASEVHLRPRRAFRP